MLSPASRLTSYRSRSTASILRGVYTYINHTNEYIGYLARDYVTARIKHKIERAERGEYRGGDADGCQRQLSFVERYWILDLDDTPHMLVYSNLGPNNIVVDDEFNVQRYAIYTILYISSS